jgi:hypothetical protein
MVRPGPVTLRRWLLTVAVLAAGMWVAAATEPDRCHGDPACLAANAFAGAYAGWTAIVNTLPAQAPVIDAREPKAWEAVVVRFHQLQHARDKQFRGGR